MGTVTCPMGMGAAATMFVLSSLAAFAPARAVAEQPVTVEGSGCRLWDHYPDRRKTLRWSGTCRNDWVNGPGVLEWFYDGRYDGRAEGTFVDGRLEGRARVAWRDGRRLDADFRRGVASGQGTHVWPDGRTYQGAWQDDRRTGFGTLSFPDGSRYVGAFRRNRPTGEGEFVTADGRHVQARVDARGQVGPGAPLNRPQQSATIPPVDASPADTPPDSEPSGPERLGKPQRLEDWLNEPTRAPR